MSEITSEHDLELLEPPPETGPADVLAVVTFADLQDRIQAKLTRTTAADSREAWQSLLTIVEDLIRSPTSGGIDAVTGRHWSLTQLQVSGYQGVGTDPSLRLTIDPTPGITVIHGPNGAGKSSLADAIDAVMHGKPSGSSPPASGTGGRTPLWNRVQCGRDAEQATIELTLVDGTERLHLSGTIDTNGTMTSWTVELESGGDRHRVQLDSTWDSALAGHQPVFGYGALERRVQTSGELQTYLELLIALGGCFAIVNEEVNRRGATADTAFTAWRDALATAQLAVTEIDASRVHGDDLKEVNWPSVDDDPDDWLRSEQLTEAGEALPEIDTTHRSSFSTATADVTTALDQLDTARISTLEQVANGLGQLNEEASGLADPGQTCPVCEASDVDWRSVLAESVSKLSHISVLSETAVETLVDLKSVVQGSLVPMLAVSSSTTDPLLTDQHSLGSRLLQDFTRATDRGFEPGPAVVSAARALAGWAQSDGCDRLFDHAIEVSDRRRQWLRARRAAVAGFLEVWRLHQSEARQKGRWDICKRHLITLSNELRGERVQQLQERAGQRISALLHDAGIELKSIEMSKSKADLVLMDSAGSKMTLGMLSSGQRNAVLLAPLLALTTGGPFGFVVLDDPVHAFDGLRVDRLAAVISEIAETRRVIVLTHDERLREHLLAVSSEARAHQIARDHGTGTVALAPGKPMWEILLDDAYGALALTGTVIETLGTTDLVRGLCRQALDDALRGFVVRIATRNGADVEEALSVLDAVDTTRKRLAATSSLAGRYGADTSAVSDAEGLVDPFLRGWNAAAHGNPPQSAAVSAEIRAALRACRRLAEEPTT